MLTTSLLDFDSFLPSAIERYHQLLIPALQLAVSVLSAAGHTPVVSKQVWPLLAQTIVVLMNIAVGSGLRIGTPDDHPRSPHRSVG